ncbi:hypothetical protein EDD21DRAFT_392525 [Dissophora ornata]|nr:hypothetical protein EDD21DRAFT_392525 [Dissophora ornata]
MNRPTTGTSGGRNAEHVQRPLRVHQLPASQFHPTLAPISRAAVDANIATGDGISSASSSVGDCIGYDKSAILMLKVKGITTTASTSTCNSRHTAVSTHACRCSQLQKHRHLLQRFSYCTRSKSDDWADRYVHRLSTMSQVWDEYRAFDFKLEANH